MADPVNDTLDSLVSDASNTAQTNIAASTGKVPDPLQNMLNIFQQSFPDQTFTVQGNKIVGEPKAIPANAVPFGYQPDKAITGIQELQKSLEDKTLSIDDRYSIATRLNAMIQTQKMYKFDQYRTQAEAMYGIPDLLNTIESLKRAEAVSPFNPGDGAMSQQRFEVLQTLGTARTAAANRVKDLMATDPTFAAAENLAGSTIAEIEGKLKIQDRQDRMDTRQILKDAREGQINAIDPNVVASIGVIRNGKTPTTPEEKRSIAEMVVDGKLHLTPAEKFMASADDQNLIAFYSATKDPKDRLTALQVLQSREATAINNPDQAKTNIKLFESVMKIDPADKTDPRVTPEIRRRWQQAQQDAQLAKVSGSGKSADEVLQDRKLAIQRDILKDVVTKAVFSDVKQWQGPIQSDPAAQAVLKIWQGNRAMPINDFIDHYLEYNDGQSVTQKSRSLQAIIAGGIEALPRSSILPIPAPESALLSAQKMVAARSVTKSFQSTGVFGLDLLRSNIPGVNK